MSKYLKIFGILLIIIILGGATVALGLSYGIAVNRINSAQNQISNADVSVDAKSLEGQIEELISQVNNLRNASENSSLGNYGMIQGDILPFITESSGLTRYQRVCAESASNESFITCTTVDTNSREYELTVSEGEYYVYAMLVGDDISESLTDFKSYYTQLVACEQNQDSSEECSEDLGGLKQLVTVEPGSLTQNIDPIGWQL